jgi:hypothetical protein
MQRLEASEEGEHGRAEEDAPRSAQLPSEGKNMLAKKTLILDLEFCFVET